MNVRNLLRKKLFTLHKTDKFTDVVKSFDEVQKITNCSTGCGGCHDKILDVISELMMG